MVAKNEQEGLGSHNQSQPGAVSGDEAIKVDRRFVDGAIVAKGKKSLVDVDKVTEAEADALEGVGKVPNPEPKSRLAEQDVVVTVTLGTPTEIVKN